MVLKSGETEVRRLVRWLRRDPKIALRFEDRRYKLGDTIDVEVDISASRDIHFTESLVTLEHERKYIENNSMMVPDYMLNRATSRSALLGYKLMIPKRVTQEFTECFLHSSATFASETSLPADSRHSFNVRLVIQTYVPPHCGEGITRWLLKAVLRLPSGREITQAEQVTISLV